jgi:HemY protein
MMRLVLLLLGVLALSTGLAWLADRPGNIVVDWEGHRGELSVFNAVVIFAALTAVAMLVWTILRQLWSSPATVGQFLVKRRQQRGLDALSSGMIAVGAGDRANATRHALQARKALPNEPLTHLLRAQAAQLSGDKTTARRIFEAMLSSPDTEQLGLRGLYLEAARVKETEAARQFAERAVRLNPKLSWPVEALFDLQCKAGDWAAALETLATARRHGNIDKSAADRRRAVLLTAKAQALEDGEPEKALTLALEAHGLAPTLIPAAAIAGRLLASRGNTPRAAKVLQKTWAKSPHPELATAYAYARIGDSPRDRLDRVKQLTALNPHTIESPIAVATAAVEAKQFDEARRALAPLLDGRLTQRVATLMARIEGEEHGNKGKVREWLARAVNAPRDPAWTADGVVSDKWAPVSPVSGTFDAFQWRVPVDDMQPTEGEELTTRLESLVPLGASLETDNSEHAAGAGLAGDASRDPGSPDNDDMTVAPHGQRMPLGSRATTIDAEIVTEEPKAQPRLKAQDEASTEPRRRSEATHASAGAGRESAEPDTIPSGSAPGNHGNAQAASQPVARSQSRTSRTASRFEPRAKQGKETGSRAEPDIFVPPRAPDDPGTDEASEAADLDAVPRSQRRL